MAATILYAAIVLMASRRADAQSTPLSDPFAKGRWRVEIETLAAPEAWNYNVSHEELYGLSEAVTYGLRDGLLLRAGQRLIYVSQRSQDAVVLGLTGGVRQRLFERRRISVFVQGEVGISHTAVAAPPRGTRFNYLAIGGGGALIRVAARVHVIGALQVIHVSNAGVKGAARNPDIEAIGPSLGLSVGFDEH